MMDTSKEFQFMITKAIESEPFDFDEFNITENVQDQLQAMIKVYLAKRQIVHDLDVLKSFIYFVKTKRFIDIMYGYDYTIEMWWLSFVMEELHNKVWSEEGWVSE